MPKTRRVEVRRQTVVFPTYEPHWPDRNPMFLEKRVYQGSSGRVYPLPFTDRIAEKPEPRAWETIFIENEFLEVMILPALGGRIHRLLDKTNGYDAIYYQPVIKPALVGLAGPWISGGIEFNWPQHHRPSTFLPADVAIERHPNGAATVWLGEHDPMARMKGMHGVRLHPGRSVLELVARAYNRTPDTQTFLWWANVATRVHEHYQSFFPPDVAHVADHARRAMSAFPHARGRYYGVDYAGRGRKGVPPGETPRQFVPPRGAYAPDDLSRYANIPVPTSYMAMGSDRDFVGGYDHRAEAGLIHVANHHISPGKKQWTWGNHEFGYAWDRNLTDPDAAGEYGPYIELMAGVYTDNQPDFSFLQPGETKTWSQFWYPIRSIGPAVQANAEAAVSLRLGRGRAQIGVAATAEHPGAWIELSRRGKVIARKRRSLGPGRPFRFAAGLPRGTRAQNLALRVLTRQGAELVSHAPRRSTAEKAPPAATEPPRPRAVGSADELYVIGLHLEQYRHATRAPQDYWREALRRDPGDARSNLALGRWHLRRGEFAAAERHLRASVARLTSRNPNPADGEPHYQLGLCLRHRAFAADLDPALIEQAYAAFYKATWNQAWQAAGFHALAEIDALRGNWEAALGHLDRALRLDSDNLRARDLKAVALRRLGRGPEAAVLLRETLALDPLDWWARHLSGGELRCDPQVRLDLALDYSRAGLWAEALEVLEDSAAGPRTRGPRAPASIPPPRLPDNALGTAPLLSYYRAWFSRRLGDARAERRHLAAAAKAPPGHCFPARLEEIAILGRAVAARPRDARAPFYLGNLLYDRRRHGEAIALWRRAVRAEPRNAVAWRNLGIGCFNILGRPAAARAAYDRAFRAAPRDARLLYERDQLWKRLGVAPGRRLRELRRHPRLVSARDDLTVEFCALLNRTGRPREAEGVLAGRRFQPWEGGEGQALGQHVRAQLLLGREALRQDDARSRRSGLGQAAAPGRSDRSGAVASAIGHFRAALEAPENLGEAKHPLANQGDIHFELGRALEAAGAVDGAREHWTAAAEFKGDFQTMSVRAFSEMTYYSALALEKLGRKAEARRLLRQLLAYARGLARAPAQIDYFATSLPTMLLFEEDLAARQRTTALLLEAQARLGLGQAAAARRLRREVLRRDPNHALAADLLS